MLKSVNWWDWQLDQDDLWGEEEDHEWEDPAYGEPSTG